MNIELEVEHKGVKYDVEIDYQPEEKPYFNYREGYGDPGCGSQIEGINKIDHYGDCFLETFEGDESFDESIYKALETYFEPDF